MSLSNVAGADAKPDGKPVTPTSSPCDKRWILFCIIILLHMPVATHTVQCADPTVASQCVETVIIPWQRVCFHLGDTIEGCVVHVEPPSFFFTITTALDHAPDPGLMRPFHSVYKEK